MAVFCQATAFGLLLSAVGLLPLGSVATGQSDGDAKVHFARNATNIKRAILYVLMIHNLLRVAAIP